MKEILINSMYNDNKGAYANEEKNIVHEIINLFKTDNGNYYIYIVSDGMINANHNDCVSDIILTRNTGDKTAEIVAWVKNPIQIAKCKKNLKKEQNKLIILEEQSKYLDEIKYGGVSISEIFKGNTYRGKLESEKNMIYATYKAKEVLIPKESIFLTYKKENSYKPNTYFIKKHFINNSQRAYIEENEKDFMTLENLFKADRWKENEFAKIDVEEYMKKREKKEEHFNFLKLIHHEYYEPAFSNLFQYYFLKNKKIFEKFAKEILGVEINTNSKEFEINREEYNIDLLIRDENNIIVIENKIKSGINGIKYDEYGDIVQDQLKKYYEYAISQEKNIKNTNESHSKDVKRKPHLYIFVPNYKHLDVKYFNKAKMYKKIEYKKIYEFYKRYKDTEFAKDKYFEDFLNALYKHTLSIDSDIYEKMLDRFMSKIQNVQNTKKINY